MTDEFKTDGYQKHNKARQDHLASLGLDLTRKTVLEIGAGIGDHTGFWLERNCYVTCIEARPENCARISSRYPDVPVICHDLDEDWLPIDREYDIVYAYGILYHLENPQQALNLWTCATGGLLLLETCVSLGRSQFKILEKKGPTASYRGYKCRPSRGWVFNVLREYLPYVYVPKTQPDHEEFPLDWEDANHGGNSRAVFIGSKTELEQELPLLTDLPRFHEPLVRRPLSITKRHELGQLLRHMNLLGPAVEVGSAEGRFATEILAWGVSHLYVVDVWGNKADRQKCLEVLTPHAERTTILEGLSVEMADHISDGTCDFIYIDASHDEASVRHDLNKYWPKLTERGIIAGHDYHMPGVCMAVNRFAEQKNLTLHLLPVDENDISYWLERPQ